MHRNHRTTDRTNRHLTMPPVRATLLALALVAVTSMPSVAETTTQTEQQKAESEAEARYNNKRHVDPSGFPWPNGAKIALSLTFDDGRDSQVEFAVPLLDSFDVKATFYPLPEAVGEQLEGWKRAVASGHEIGNHTVGHPCTGNFAWTRYDGVVLESYDLDSIRDEMIRANEQIESMLGVTPVSFAYPCGQIYVGRGSETMSYVPIVAEVFKTGRRWLDETSNAPEHYDRSQIMARRMDGEDFDSILRLIERTKRQENWLVLAGHGVGEQPRWGTDLQMLRELLAYAQDPANGVWIAPMKDVVAYIDEHRTDRP